MLRGALDLFNTGICRNTRWCDGVVGGVRRGLLPTGHSAKSWCLPKLDGVSAVWRSRWLLKGAQSNLITIMARFKSLFKTRCIDGYHTERSHIRTGGVHPSLQSVVDTLSTFSTLALMSLTIPKVPLTPLLTYLPALPPTTLSGIITRSDTRHTPPCSQPLNLPNLHPGPLINLPVSPSSPPPHLAPLPPDLTQRTKTHCLPVTIRFGAQ